MSSPIGGSSPVSPNSRLGDPSQPTAAQMAAQIQVYLNNNDFNGMFQYIYSNIDNLTQYPSVASNLSSWMVGISSTDPDIASGCALQLMIILKAAPTPPPPTPSPQPSKDEMAQELSTYSKYPNDSGFFFIMSYIVTNFDAMKQAISPNDPMQYMQQIAQFTSNPNGATAAVDKLIALLGGGP